MKQIKIKLKKEMLNVCKEISHTPHSLSADDF